MKLLLTIIAVVLLATTAFAAPIHDAARVGDLAGVQAELDKGVDVNEKDDGGYTLLHYASMRGHKEVAELLIANGADLNAKDGGGYTPLLHAYFYAGLIELLIENGANPNVTLTDWAGMHYTVIDWYDWLARNAMYGVEAKIDIKENANLIRKLGGKSYSELNPPEIAIFYNTVDSKVYISVFGAEGSTFDVLHSSNLNDWKVLKTVTIDKRRHASLDPEKTLGSSFYKIRPID